MLDIFNRDDEDENGAGDGDQDPDSAPATDGGGALFESTDDELDDIPGLEETGDDMFDGMANSDGADTDELDHRIDELENEVAGLTSSVNTVKRENEQISETVEEVEENVRKLLDIYEMVTRGVNPFVDEAGPEMAGANAGGFGVFQTEEEDTKSDETLSPDVAEAEAEEFFEDPVDEPEVEEHPDSDVQTSSDTGGNDGSGASGGTTFEELKEEYDSGDADWAEDGEQSIPNGGDNESTTESTADHDPSPVDRGSDQPQANESVPAASEATGDDTSPPGDPERERSTGEPRPKSDPGSDHHTTPAPTTEHTPESGDVAFVEDTVANAPEKPYLTAIPGGYLGDLLVMEWLEYLIDAANVADARRAIRYYVDIEWIDETVAETLETYLSGLGTLEAETAEGVVESEKAESETATSSSPESVPQTLTITEHTESLRYICRLRTDNPSVSLLTADAPESTERTENPEEAALDQAIQETRKPN